MKQVKLTELIDIEILQKVQDGFSNFTGMAALTTDADGVAVTKGSHFTEFCMNLTRKSKEGKARCEKCDKYGGEQTMRTGKHSTYFCHAGLVDFAAPIMLNGEMIGSFIGGQVLTEPPDESKFRKIAHELNINPEEYLKAVKKVKILEKNRIEDAAEYLFTIAEALSHVACSNYMAAETNTGLSTLTDTMYHKIQNAEDIVDKSLESIKSLLLSFGELSQSAGRTIDDINVISKMVSVIKNIAMNTRFLGVNASIEASRAKESGKGFSVIAQEIQKLAETSKTSADDIQSIMKQLSDNSGNVNNAIETTNKIINLLAEDLKYFSTLLNEIKHIGKEQAD